VRYAERIAIGCILGLGSCAAAPQLPPQAPPAPVAGQMTLGRIVAIRAVTVADNTGAPGLNAVLKALDQPSAVTPVSGNEIVIRQDDGGTIDVAEANVQGFAVGDEVGVIVTDHTALVHR
jgi:outer membrane lipoprotein SlyB